MKKIITQLFTFVLQYLYEDDGLIFIVTLLALRGINGMYREPPAYVPTEILPSHNSAAHSPG